ncbi:hypothetical protein SteCoe_31710 [Stentor coeruleus]|uniref:Uncharacterized protein n=1 Tax=Stentor coeruleus TaxID=5963 RepID=A0A1R2B0X0_9CILI|nr:hypothetical protein SteCoe_31710 [Stentor coeruleus]
MNALNSEKTQKIIIGSCCFVCGVEFSLGNRQPVKLHDNPIHEICYSCFKLYKPTQCYLDSKSISEIQTIEKYPILYRLISRACAIHGIADGSEKFSYYTHRPPYFFCCGDYICESCKSAGGSAMCSGCGSSISIYSLSKDDTFIHQLKFLEIFCETHHDQISKYFDSVNIKSYCSQCKSIPPKIRNEINPEKFDEAINKKLKEITITYSNLFTEFLKKFEIYPLVVKFRANRFYEALVKSSQESNGQLKYITENTSLRFKKIQPTLSNTFMKWYLRKPKMYEIVISCSGSLELSGIIVGKSFSENASVTVKNAGFVIVSAGVSRIYSQESFETVNFNCLVPINSTGVVLQIEFNAGGYIHGCYKSLDNNFNFKGIPVTVRSNNDCKDLERGGPLLGFSFSSFYISDNEFP